MTQDAPRGPGRAVFEQRLRYTGGSAILVRGPVTGRSYSFSLDSPEHAVARADIDALLRTGLFVRGAP